VAPPPKVEVVEPKPAGREPNKPPEDAVLLAPNAFVVFVLPPPKRPPPVLLVPPNVDEPVAPNVGRAPNVLVEAVLVPKPLEPAVSAEDVRASPKPPPVLVLAPPPKRPPPVFCCCCGWPKPPVLAACPNPCC
jgi:hypothetical protein